MEFGTSYGISTLYLAAAVTDNGTGHVFTTELSKKKAAAARANLDEAGVGGAVTILPGDALETLAAVPGPVGIALVDGWKDLYLPVLRLLEPKLAPGALVAADDTTFTTMADYLKYVRDPPTATSASRPPSKTAWKSAAGQPDQPPGHDNAEHPHRPEEKRRGPGQPVRRSTAARASGGRSSPASSRLGSSSDSVVRARNNRPMVTVCLGRQTTSMRSPALISPGTTTRR